MILIKSDIELKTAHLTSAKQWECFWSLSNQYRPVSNIVATAKEIL